MPDAADLIKVIKRAAVEAVAASKPAEVCFGKVTSASPLKILVEQKLLLGEAQLVLTRNVTDYQTAITGDNVKDYYYIGKFPDHVIEKPLNPPHKHAVGRIDIIVHNGLVVGDEVLLIRQQGGQKYVVVDRLG